MSDKLTPKQQRFVDEFLLDLNATAAAKRAGYKQPNKQGPRLLVNVGIAEAIARAQAQRAHRAEIDGVQTLRESACIAFSDLGGLFEFTPQGVRLRPEAWNNERLRRAVASIKVRRELGTDNSPPAEVVEFRLWDKLSAIKHIDQRLGLLTEKHQHEHTGEVKITHRAEDLSDDQLAAIAARK